jgi:hypothetical protein
MNVAELKAILNGLDESCDEFEVYTEGCDCFGYDCGVQLERHKKRLLIAREVDQTQLFDEVDKPEPPELPFRPASRLGPMAP